MTTEYTKHKNAFATINSSWDYIVNNIPAAVEGYWDMEAIVKVAIEIYNLRTERQIKLDDEQCTSINDYSIIIESLLRNRSMSNEEILSAITK